MKNTIPLLFLLGGLLLSSSCDMPEAKKPLRERLQGEWLMTKSTTTYFDSLGNQMEQQQVYQHDYNGRNFSIFIFQDTIVDIKRLRDPSAFPYELKESEGQDSILALTFTRNHPAHRIGVTFPEENKMLWRSRSFHSKLPTTPHPDMEVETEFKRVKFEKDK
ncbi:hypothetical protein CLV24_104249 [Pontibacter ummariensis]|uniref:Uncharacterized protein n=1 Tax=Pontibacter ummariensis TaxID=1610492 RepID=A0A239DIX8_9BACT|nr:hypothetical protein [Pontibacter ummariensis]PRY14436.1 hypothetical protein CLV24_104249 [Pontibacter ummariensis]SNS31951.1 hypothetical protein SAMN06296052_104248 [Pontibacter ummariensis]